MVRLRAWISRYFRRARGPFLIPNDALVLVDHRGKLGVRGCAVSWLQQARRGEPPRLPSPKEVSWASVCVYPGGGAETKRAQGLGQRFSRSDPPRRLTQQP